MEGAYVIDIEKHEDQRGFFSRSFCKHEFTRMELETNIVQCNISFNTMKGTIRGMHYQASPHQEAKLVSCIKGRVYDVIVDLRSESPTYCQWQKVELDADDFRMIYVPDGCAHGFQTLKDNSAVFYQMFEYFHKESGRGVRWDDNAFGINWPLPVKIITERDCTYSDFKK